MKEFNKSEILENAKQTYAKRTRKYITRGYITFESTKIKDQERKTIDIF